MSFILNYWGYLAILVSTFTIALLFIIGNHCIKIIFRLLTTNKMGEIARKEKLDTLKGPVVAILILLILNIIFILLDTPEVIFSINNTILITFFGFVILYLINTLIKTWKNIWEEDEKLKYNTGPLQYVRWFLWILVITVYTLLFITVWNIEFSVILELLRAIKENKLLNALSVFIIFLLLANNILYVFKTYIKNIVRTKETPYDNIIISKIEYPISLIIVLIGANISIQQLGLHESTIIPLINTSIIVILMYTANILVENLIDYWERKVKKRCTGKIDDGIFILVQNVSKVVIIFITILLILFAWDLIKQLKGVLFSLSVVGVVLGIALRETFSNVVSGISLMLDHTFQSKDLIQLEDSEMGMVKKIGLRSTKVVTFDNKLLTIPNSTIANSKVLNYTQPDSKTRITIDVGVEYGSDPEKVEKVLMDVIKDKEFIIFPEKSEVWFKEMSDFSMKFRLLFHVNDFMESFKIKSDITKEIYHSLQKNKIKIALPARVIYTQNEKSPTRNKKRNPKKSK